ncbi:MAG: hypothetical protein ABJA67_08485, partial [Chthonomonadales bacterium]
RYEEVGTDEHHLVHLRHGRLALKMRSNTIRNAGGLIATLLLLSIILTGCSPKAPEPEKVDPGVAKTDTDAGKSPMPGGGPPGDKK